MSSPLELEEPRCFLPFLRHALYNSGCDHFRSIGSGAISPELLESARQARSGYSSTVSAVFTRFVSTRCLAQTDRPTDGSPTRNNSANDTTVVELHQRISLELF